jgi:AbrB family looped-hinge helix DNA binding protein
MKYSTTITKKGQMTIPKEVRENLDILIPSQITLDVDEKEKTVRIIPQKDILDLAGRFKVKKPADVLKAREKFEKTYERK